MRVRYSALLEMAKAPERSGLEIMESVTARLWNRYMDTCPRQPAVYTAYYIAAALRDEIREPGSSRLAQKLARRARGAR